MRLLMGIIIGCALTIGGAYLADAINSGPAPGRQMVNWDVVSQNLSAISHLAREGWRKITG